MKWYEWYVDAIKNHYFDFNGRSRRSAYWFFVLLNIIVTIVIVVIDFAIGTYPIIYYVYALAIFLPNLGLAVRRMHDIDKSGWWVLVALIPFVGWIWLIILAATDSTRGENQFGANPKGE
ncbi:MAG: DUF805 domain-containing protein [Campylobacteraceae bacterium]|jgi:uncharacterized membrane protein YhaH (DUF805 family)|nr:DUF805 domain-containing protein [Campylobacteraceae bacterium]